MRRNSPGKGRIIRQLTIIIQLEPQALSISLRSSDVPALYYLILIYTCNDAEQFCFVYQQQWPRNAEYSFWCPVKSNLVSIPLSSQLVSHRVQRFHSFSTSFTLLTATPDSGFQPHTSYYAMMNLYPNQKRTNMSQSVLNCTVLLVVSLESTSIWSCRPSRVSLQEPG